MPLVGTERPAVPTRMEPGGRCELNRLSSAKHAVAAIDDDAEHELATCYAIRDKGLIVTTSCGHRGVINSNRQAQVASGTDKVHAVIGGFHLVAPRTHDEAIATVDAFEEIDPDYIVPKHCTGEAFVAELISRLPEKLIRPYVGSRIQFWHPRVTPSSMRARSRPLATSFRQPCARYEWPWRSGPSRNGLSATPGGRGAGPRGIAGLARRL